MANIFVDFDDTLTDGSGEPYWVDPLDDSPNEDMVQLVNDLYKKGHTIIIYTARREEARDETEYYLNKWDVMYHALRMEKPGFDLLIDDRAISDKTALELGAEGIDEGNYNDKKAEECIDFLDGDIWNREDIEEFMEKYSSDYFAEEEPNVNPEELPDKSTHGYSYDKLESLKEDAKSLFSKFFK